MERPLEPALRRRRPRAPSVDSIDEAPHQPLPPLFALLPLTRSCEKTAAQTAAQTAAAHVAFDPVPAGGDPPPPPGLPLFAGTPQRLYDHPRPRHFGAVPGGGFDEPNDAPVEAVLARLRALQDGQPPRYQALAPPAHTAASRGDLAELQRVHGCDPPCLYALDGEGRSVLAVAAEAGSRDVVQWLVALHPADWPVRYHVVVPLHDPAGVPRLEADSLLGRTHPALAAARMGRVDIAAFLVDAWPLEVVTEPVDVAVPLPTLDALHGVATHALAAMLVAGAAVGVCCGGRAVALAAWAIPWRRCAPEVFSAFGALNALLTAIYLRDGGGWVRALAWWVASHFVRTLAWEWSAFAPARLVPRAITAWLPLAGAVGAVMALCVLAHSLRRVWREDNADSEAAPPGAARGGQPPPPRRVVWWPLWRASRRVLAPAFDMADVQLRVLRHLAMHAQRDALLAWIARPDVALLLRAVSDAAARSDGDAVEWWVPVTLLPPPTTALAAAAGGRVVCTRAAAARAFAAGAPPPPPARATAPSSDTWPLDDVRVRWAAARALLRSQAALLLSRLPSLSAWLDALLACGATAPAQLGGRVPWRWRRTCVLRLRLPYHPREATACFATTLGYLAHDRQLAALHAVSHAAWLFSGRARRGQVLFGSVRAPTDTGVPPAGVDARRLWPLPELLCLGGAYATLPRAEVARMHMDLRAMWLSSFALARVAYGVAPGTDPMTFLARGLELARARSGSTEPLPGMSPSVLAIDHALRGCPGYHTGPTAHLLFIASLMETPGFPHHAITLAYFASEVVTVLSITVMFALATAVAALGVLAHVALLRDPIGVTVRVVDAALERSSLLWSYGEALVGGLVYGSNGAAFDELRESAPAVPLPSDALRASLLRARRGGGGGGGGGGGDADGDDDGDLDADVPPDFIDPVMQALLADPVAAFDGHTYSGAALERWVLTCVLAQRPTTSPLTNVPFSALWSRGVPLRAGPIGVVIGLPPSWVAQLAACFPAVPNPVRAARIALHWAYVAAADRGYMLAYARFMGQLAGWSLRRVRVWTLAGRLAALGVDAALLLGELGACAASLALAAAAGLACVAAHVSHVLVFRAPVLCGFRAARAAAPHRYVARSVGWAVYVAVCFGALWAAWAAALAAGVVARPRARA